MTKARLQNAKRLFELHKDLQRLEEQRIAGLKVRRADVASQEEHIVAALNSDAGPQGLVLPVLLRRLNSLRDESLRIDEDLERRARALQTLASRTKHAERLSRTYEQLNARASSDKELLDIIERITQPKDASLP